MYNVAVSPSFVDVMVMAVNIWEAIDIAMIQINHIFASTAIVATKPPVTPSIATPTNIKLIPSLSMKM